jgi:hypothetical protein
MSIIGRRPNLKPTETVPTTAFIYSASLQETTCEKYSTVHEDCVFYCEGTSVISAPPGNGLGCNVAVAAGKKEAGL